MILPGDSFQLEYRYEAPSQDLLNSWKKENKTTGFHLTWFLQDGNGTKITDDKSSKSDVLSWDSLSEDDKVDRKHKGLELARQFAKHFRLQNMSVDTLVERAITKKIVSTDLLQKPGSGMLCSKSHLLEGHDDSLFGQIISFLKTNVNDIDDYENGESSVADHLYVNIDVEDDIHDDITTGFKLFSALVFCPDPNHLEKLKPYKFTYNLVTSQSLPTIVQAIVNAAESKLYKIEFSELYK